MSKTIQCPVSYHLRGTRSFNDLQSIQSSVRHSKRLLSKYNDQEVGTKKSKPEVPEHLFAIKDFASITTADKLKQLFVDIENTLRNLDQSTTNEKLILDGDRFFKHFYLINFGKAPRNVLQNCLAKVTPLMKQKNCHQKLLDYVAIFTHEISNVTRVSALSEIIRICVIRSGIENFLDCIEFQPNMEKYHKWKFDADINELDLLLGKWRCAASQIEKDQIPENLTNDHFWWYGY